jgi:hypothetical protein
MLYPLANQQLYPKVEGAHREALGTSPVYQTLKVGIPMVMQTLLVLEK